jgi:uncharacterized protein YebE (UPF0316 family)
MEFLSEKSIWVYLFIFFGKNIEVAVTTLRIVLINRGERLKGSIVAFFDVLLWLFITGTVLQGFKDDLWRTAVFALGFVTGNYLGSWLEAKLAFGLCSIQVIVPKSEQSQKLADILRDNAYAVTVVAGQGKDRVRDLLLLHLRRKRIPNAIHIINDHMPDSMVTVQDTRVIRGGYIKK